MMKWRDKMRYIRYIKIYITVWFGLLMILSKPLRAAVIELCDEVKISGPKITVGEIAQISGLADEDMLRKVKAIVVGNAALPGQSRNVSINYVKIRLRQNGIDPSGFTFKGPQSVLVTTCFQIVDKFRLSELAEEYVLKNMPWQKAEVSIEIEKVPEEVIIPEGEVLIEMVPRCNMDFIGNTILEARIHVNKIEYTTVPIYLKIKRFGEVVVSKRRIAKHELISEDDLYVRKEELTNLPADVIRKIEDVVGKQAKSVIAPYKILTSHMVEQPPLIKRREIVTLLLETPAMRITTKAQARQDGCKGQIIRVKNLDSRKELEAVVISDSVVKVVY